LFFINPSTSYWSTAGGHGYSSDGTRKYTLCNSDSVKIYVLSQYSQSGGNSSGILYDYNSGIFIDNSKYLLLSEKNKIYSYQIDSIPKFTVKTLNEFSQNQDINLANTFDEKFFFIYAGDSIKIYNIHDFICYSTFKVDAVDIIRKPICSYDNSFLLLSDNKGNLVRIPNNDVFKL
jgi:hypothetical protein